MGNRILVTRSSMPPMEEYFEEVAPLWESHWLTNMGVEHKKLEADLKERLGIDNLALFTNGHNALECILEAMALPTGGEVITTPFTFASTTHAIVRKGLTPVFADVNPVNLTLDPESIERLITPRTCAIVPVHVYGNLCDVDAIQEIADRHGLKVIYDAAHAFGVERVNEDGSSDSAATFAMQPCSASMRPRYSTPSKAVASVSRTRICIRCSTNGRTSASRDPRTSSTSVATPR